jgi:GNAT superfamily N-acetyltransferase
MSELTVRAAAIDDLSRLSQLWYEHATLLVQQDGRWSLQSDARDAWERAAQAWLGDDDACVLVAQIEIEIVGFIIVTIQPAPIGFMPEVLGTVHVMALDAHRHAPGAARLLLADARDWLASKGVDQMVVDVPKRAAIDQAFWRAQHGLPWMERLWIPS